MESFDPSTRVYMFTPSLEEDPHYSLNPFNATSGFRSMMTLRGLAAEVFNNESPTRDQVDCVGRSLSGRVTHNNELTIGELRAKLGVSSASIAESFSEDEDVRSVDTYNASPEFFGSSFERAAPPKQLRRRDMTQSLPLGTLMQGAFLLMLCWIGLWAANKYYNPR
ncbi:MAG: hypothetical protein A3F09_02490 [Chlamydiae bacterium RIFCSPHIGHO2_12_FULL_49_11]|nr:MAG: hypothetical protein A3F09_02490 [Chlamydiae bacterium RIFCSPHIGHO2_12_FULL_49_11]